MSTVEILGEHIAIELPGATALFTTRRGGCSRGPYESLNLGRFTADDRAAVEHNRASLQAALGVRFAFGRQVHGAEVCIVRDVRGPELDPPEADGQATRLGGVAPMVLTADCLPIALAGGGAVAMLHAGWRGLACGVIAEGVRAVRELARAGGAGPGRELSAAIGPGAGPCCYEVSEDVHRTFASYGPLVRRGRKLDLKTVARLQLADAGVSDVHDAGICTICADRELFFSHRRDKGLTGRQAGIIWLS